MKLVPLLVLSFAAAACSNAVYVSPSGAGASSTTTSTIATAGTGGTTGTGDTTGAGGTGATTGTGGTTTTDTLPPCDVTIDTMAGPVAPGFSCTLPEPCPAAVLVIPSDPSVAVAFTDPTAPACILTKLRDREVSSLTFGKDISYDMSTSETVFVVDAQHGVSNWTYENDLDYGGGTRNRRILQPPSYFDGCLQLTDPTAIYACLSSWDAGCDGVAVTCPGT